MSQDRLFLDTVFIQSILNPRDQYHSPDMELLPRIKNAQEVWTTEAIFMEVGNAAPTIFIKWLLLFKNVIKLTMF